MIAAVLLPILADHDAERRGRFLRRAEAKAECGNDVRARKRVFLACACALQRTQRARSTTRDA